MTSLRRGCAVAALAAASLLVVAAPAAASCASDSGPVGSDVVFVGTAEEERRGYTRLAVAEVWRGPDLAPEVWVLSGQEQPPFPLNLLQTVSGSTDAELVPGHRYVIGATEGFDTGLCSIRELPGTERPESRPGDVRGPVASGSEGADPPAGPWAIGLATAAAGLTGAGALWWLRRRRATG